MAADTRRRRRGIRGRTTILAVVVIGLTLVVGAIALEVMLRRSIISNIDSVAEVRAEDIAALARQGQLPAKIEAPADDSAVQVLDAAGNVIASSANVVGRPPVGPPYVGRNEATSRSADNVGGIPLHFRLIAFRSTAPSGPITVYIATSLEPVDDTIVVLRRSLAIGGPLLLLLVSALTWAAVGRSLAPVEAIRAEVADISSRQLDRRVPEPGTGDEIGRLAETMNAMLERLQLASERQRRFVADASHELQTPLAAARTDLEVALAHPHAAEWPQTARDLLEENRNMERLVSDLLFIAKADGAAPHTPATPVDLHEVVFAETARLSSSSRAAVDTSGVAGAFVLGWRDDLARAIRNLLDNASRHARSTVSVSLSQTDGLVRLSVEDDGVGVPADQSDRIFERFARVEDARSRTEGGTGLGLAIVKEIVLRHDGAVWVEPGATGARFMVTLPPD
jgi:signal transduction histidine kinase